MSNLRVQFDMNEKALFELDRWKEMAGVDTRKNYVEYALSTLEWVLEQTQKGLVVAAIDEKKGTFRELAMPPINRIKRLAQHDANDANIN